MSFTESLAKIIEENRNQLVGKHAAWERVRLADVANILNGFPFESRRFGANPEKGRPLIRIRDVLRGRSDTYYEGEVDPAYLVQHPHSRQSSHSARMRRGGLRRTSPSCRSLFDKRAPSVDSAFEP
jgi:hypothetical protein